MRLYCHVCGKVQAFTASANNIICEKCNYHQPINNMATRKENGSLTGSSRYKKEAEAKKANSVGTKAKQLAESATQALSQTPEAVSNVTNAVTTQTSATSSSISAGSAHTFASSSLQRHTDAYGGLAIPQTDFNSLIPSNLLKPQIQLQATEEELTVGLENYAGGTRAQRLLQAGYKYIEEVGKTKQQFHKAEASIIKAATEGVKVQQEVVRFDRQNIELSIDYEKLAQTDEKLKQEQIITSATRNETGLLIQKIEATERKKVAEIQSIDAQTQDIIQRYLKTAISGAA